MTGHGQLQNDRKALDFVILVSLTGVLVLLLLPWLWSVYSPPVPALAWTLGSFGTAYRVGSRLLDRTTNRRAALLGTWVMQVGTVLTLSWVWHLSGGVSNTAFLWAFVPILLVNALLLPGWGPYGLAAVSWLAVMTIALSESEALGWQAYRAGLPIAGLGKLIRLPHGSMVASSASEQSSQILLEMILFAGGSLGVVALGDFLSGRLGGALSLTVGPNPQEGRENLFRQVVEQDPLPRVIVDPESGAILHMSGSFRKQMLVDGSPSNLFDVVRFAEAADGRHLLSGGEAELEQCRYRIGPETRVGRLRAHRIVAERGWLVSLTFEEILLAVQTDSGQAISPRGAAPC